MKIHIETIQRRGGCRASVRHHRMDWKTDDWAYADCHNDAEMIVRTDFQERAYCAMHGRWEIEQQLDFAKWQAEEEKKRKYEEMVAEEKKRQEQEQLQARLADFDPFAPEPNDPFAPQPK